MGSMHYILVILIVINVAANTVARYTSRGSLRVCNGETYNPRVKCCCDSWKLHDIPEHDCRCCGEDAYRWNEPNDCMRNCSGQPFHTETQLCCEGKIYNTTGNHVYCCGTQLYNYRSEVCCNLENTSLLLDKRYYQCCRNFPYHHPTMRCDSSRPARRPFLKRRQYFRSQDLCGLQLPVFDHTWPPPQLYDDSHTHIRAIPESGNITMKESSGAIRVTIPLSPFALVGRHRSPWGCVESSEVMDLVVKVSSGRCCATEQELQEYLQGQVLDLWVRKGVMCGWGSLARPVLRLKDGHNAVIYRAGASSTLMK